MAAHSASAPRQFRLQLTLRQMMKLVVLAGVASACLAVGFEHWTMFRQAHFSVVMTEAVVIPLVLAVIAFPLVRRGPLKDWMIRALLFAAIAMAWTDAFIYLVRAILLWNRGRHFYQFPWFATIAEVILLPCILAWLFWTCLPGKCPDCRRFRLIRYSSGRLLSESIGTPSYDCMRCEGRYQKRDGNWNSLPRT